MAKTYADTPRTIASFDGSEIIVVQDGASPAPSGFAQMKRTTLADIRVFMQDGIARAISFKGTTTWSELQSLTGMKTGDMWTVSDRSNHNFAWDGYSWQDVGTSFDISGKADKSFVDEELDKKADIAYVESELEIKADKTYVDEELTKVGPPSGYDVVKASVAANTSSIAILNRDKADKSSLDALDGRVTALDQGKADSTDLASLSTRVQTLEDEPSIPADLEERVSANETRSLSNETKLAVTDEDIDNLFSTGGGESLRDTVAELKAKLHDYDDVKWNVEANTTDISSLTARVQTNAEALATKLNSDALLNLIYPVGSIYITVGNADGKLSSSPASWLGGTWERLASDKALWTASSGAGGTINAGLPNLEGTFIPAYGNTNRRGFNGASSTGVFKVVADSSSYYRVKPTDSTYSNGAYIGFDASRSGADAIYGKSTTVQPSAYKVYAWRRTK